MLAALISGVLRLHSASTGNTEIFQYHVSTGKNRGQEIQAFDAAELTGWYIYKSRYSTKKRSH